MQVAIVIAISGLQYSDHQQPLQSHSDLIAHPSTASIHRARHSHGRITKLGEDLPTAVATAIWGKLFSDIRLIAALVDDVRA